MTEPTEEIRVSSWCYGTQQQVYIKGKIVGKRQAELLKVSDCEEKDCLKRGKEDCLIGKLREGRWLKR